MDTVGTFAMAKALGKHKMLTALHKHYTVDQLVEFFSGDGKDLWNYVFYTVGSGEDDYKKLCEVRTKLTAKMASDHPFPSMLCIDVANGYTEQFVETVQEYRKRCHLSVIMAGNVVTPNMAEELVIKGADIVKVGIGSGSVCETRLKTGVGYPQLSAVDECAFAVHGISGHVCSDGGCRSEGDLCKALVAGADFVMTGYLFAGTDECDGEWIIDHVDTSTPVPSVSVEGHKKALKFHGMSSKEAMQKWYGGVADYRASEGKEVTINYKGSADDVAKSVLGSIRSCCTYIGARRIKDMPKCGSFVYKA